MLAQMRKALGATQLEMASLLAVSPLSYSRLEKAQAPPRTKQLAKIEEALRMGLSVAEKKIRQAAKARRRSPCGDGARSAWND